MTRPLPAHPSLIQLRHQAKELLKLQRTGAAKLSLSDAQLVIAREYGFASWPKLKLHVQGLERVEARVAWLRAAFAAADQETRERLLSCVHSRERFQDYSPTAQTLSERDARLVVANEEGYAFWRKYESYLYLDPGVQKVIAAARAGELNTLRALLHADPNAANPRWVRAEMAPAQIPNDSIPLNCVAEGVFNGTNRQGNDYQLARALIRAGADVDIDNGGPLKTAVSYYAEGAARALLEGGAAVDGPDGSGMPMAYALSFGFTEIAEILARFGARLDLRFAAGLGRLDVVRSFVNPDGSLKPDAGRLADTSENRFRCERTRENILCQALYFACLHARLETAEFLLELGADVNQEVPGVDRLGGTVVHCLSAMPLGASGDAQIYEERRLPVVELLLRRGASATMRDSRFHSTPLGWADHHGAKRMFDLLKPYAGVHDAVWFAEIDRLHELLAADSTLVNARDDLGQTPLHYLHADVQRGSEAIDLLVSAGADVNARDDSGKTPLDKMVFCGRLDLAEHLRGRGASTVC